MHNNLRGIGLPKGLDKISAKTRFCTNLGANGSKRPHNPKSVFQQQICHPERSRGTLRLASEAGCPTLFSRSVRKRVGREKTAKPDPWEGHDFSRAIKTRKQMQAPQTRPPGQEADRPLTSLPIPPPPCESSPSDGIILNLDVAVGKAAPLPFSLLRRHPYRCRHLNQFVQFFRHERPSLKRPATAKFKV